MLNWKKMLGLTIATAASFSMYTNVFAASEPILLEDNTTLGIAASDTREIVFANGTPITIEARTNEAGEEVPGAVIKYYWGGQQEKITVSEDATIFGGSHNNAEEINSTSITMNGGQVAQIYGGGLHTSNVNWANIYVYGGEVDFVLGGGAAYWARTHCSDYENIAITAENKANSKNVVNNTHVSIQGGKVKLAYGGGESSAYTKYGTLSIGGSAEVVQAVATGSNGFMDSASVNVDGGTIGILSLGNRGFINDASAYISGNANIETAYLGADADDAKNNAIINLASLYVYGGHIGTLKDGINQAADKMTFVTAVEGAIENMSVSDTVTKQKFYTVTFIGEDGEWEDALIEGTPLKDWFSEEFFEEYELLDEAGNKIDPETLVTADMTVKIAKISAEDNKAPAAPETYDNTYTFIGLGVLSLCGLGIATKKYLTK